ncbi:transporter, cation channel family protein [Besnoitia besnoiti]|uniref:Transporter, cation channel family protein n=1 Tax=Besnoitia besnoiti TaxID=94643 RepID=A0A2A9M5K3_BESBE|nr:transporter, cation channel family protein [Besnoitia besnoiti]PFH30700.1 transporter, cation channel family protein [Besnoitia besnoiti]
MQLLKWSSRATEASRGACAAEDAAGDGAVDGPEGPLSLGESVCYLFTLTLICCYDAVARLVSSPFKWLNERIVSYDIDRPDAIVDFIRFILMEEGLEDASTASALPAPGVRRKREQSSASSSSPPTGWPLLLSRLLDRNPTQQVALSVLVFLFISAVSIFGVKMCVGIIVDASRRKKARMEMEGSLLSATVHKWIEIQELPLQLGAPARRHHARLHRVDSKRLAMARKKAAALITSGCFRMAVAVHTCLCCLLLFFYGPWYDMTLGPHRQGRRLELHIAIVCLSAFFFIEIGTRIFARGRLFFREALDILDVVLCCLLAGTFGAGVVLWMGWVWRVDALTSWLLSLRLFRIARFLYRQMPFFQTLFTTISRVMKSFLSVLTLLGLSIFFFAIWGVVLFSGAQ